MSRFLDFLRRIFRVRSPHQHQEDLFAFYKPPEWSAVRQKYDGMTITTTSNPYSGFPSTFEEAQAMWDKIDAHAVEDYHEFLKKNMNLPQSRSEGMAWAGRSIFDEMHEYPAPGLWAVSDKPDTQIVHLRRDPAQDGPGLTAREGVELGAAFVEGLLEGIKRAPELAIRVDGIDAFCDALRAMGEAAAKAMAALGGMARAANDACLIDQHGTRQEIHFILHARKRRTRKKYRNRVLRRVRRMERRKSHEERTPRA